MDITRKSKFMSKDEVSLLLELIQSNPVLISKETNATTNKIKEETWIAVTSTFNASSGSVQRTKEQLKLKWDNLKKAARKRSHQIRISNQQSDDGKPDVIPADEVLEKVAAILGSICSSYMVPFGGDGVGLDKVELDTNNSMDVSDGPCLEAYVSYDVPENEENLDHTPSRAEQNADDGRRARNLAIARYYDKKTEKINMEIQLLRLQLLKYEKRNCK